MRRRPSSLAPAPRLRPAACGAALACALALPACGDDCGDGEYRDGEICFTRRPLTREVDVAGALALRTGDFDGDADADVLVIGAEAGVVAGSLFLGVGDGGLQPARPAAVAGCSAYPIAADVDADATTDLLFPTCLENLLFYRGDGGAFAAPLEIPVGVVVRTTVIADLDGDGRRDILALGLAGDVPALGLARAAPGGGFLAPQVVSAAVPGLDGFAPALLTAGRIVRDGPAEVVIGEADRSGGLARATMIDGVLSAPAAIATGLRPAGLSLRDLDDDDDLDLLVVDASPDALAPLLGPDLSEGPRTPLGALPRTIALAHLDGDGTLDAVLLHGARLGLWRGVGDGRFTADQEVEFASEVVELVLPDLNGDGRADLVAGLFPDGGLVARISGP